MSEQNILNPTATSIYNPDYPVPIPPLPDPDEVQMRDGRVYARYNALVGREFDLVWADALPSTADYLRQWAQQYRGDYFSYYDVQRDRYYTGRFKGGSVKVVDTQYNKSTVQGTFQELPGVPMYLYPQNWARDAILIAPKNSWGYVVDLTGAWSWGTSPTKSTQLLNSNSAGASCTFRYFGYGFRVWSVKSPDAGILTVTGDGNLLATLDMYAASLAWQQIALTIPAAVLGWHTVVIQNTGTKNSSSTNYYCNVDCLEVMQ